MSRGGIGSGSNRSSGGGRAGGSRSSGGSHGGVGRGKHGAGGWFSNTYDEEYYARSVPVFPLICMLIFCYILFKMGLHIVLVIFGGVLELCLHAALEQIVGHAVAKSKPFGTRVDWFIFLFHVVYFLTLFEIARLMMPPAMAETISITNFVRVIEQSFITRKA